MKTFFAWKRLFAVTGITAAALLSGCAAAPGASTGATMTASAPWCVQGKYGGYDSWLNCDRGSTRDTY